METIAKSLLVGFVAALEITDTQRKKRAGPTKIVDGTSAMRFSCGNLALFMFTL